MINKNHPKYEEYCEKFKKVYLEMVQKENEAHVSGEEGLDNSGMGEMVAIGRKYSKKLKEIQKEYSFLFSDDQDKEE